MKSLILSPKLFVLFQDAVIEMEILCPDDSFYIVDEENKDVHHFKYIGTNIHGLKTVTPPENQ